jgi:colicin import membrane protein
MQATLREHSWPVLFSVLLHAALAAAMVLMAMMSATRSTTSVQPPAVNAVVVDSRILHAAQEAQRARIAAEEQAAAARAAAAEEAKAAVESKAADEVKAADAAKAAAAQTKAADEANAAQTRAAEAKRAAETKRAVEAKQAAETKRAVEAKQAAETKRAEEAKQAAETKQAEETKQAADIKARDEHLRREREAELRRQMAEEEHVSAVEAGPLRDRYVASLRNRIQHAWIKPPSARIGVDCLVEVTQVPGGEVTSARVTQCNGDAAVRQSIENAVYRASPLPDPPDPALFQRNFAFRFKPDE